VALVQVIASVAFYEAIDRQTLREDHARRIAELLVVGSRVHTAGELASQTDGIMTTRYLEAGVSPAAPYHHFKDKSELLDAVAHEGWDLLNELMTQARKREASVGDKLTALGVAYVRFARDNPALYRVMYDASRDKDDLPEHVHQEDDSAYCQVRNTLTEAGVGPLSELDLELATTAAWCAAHGLAEMFAFKKFDPLKEAVGGDEAFLRGVFEHMGIFGRASQD